MSRMLTREQEKVILKFMSKKYTILTGPSDTGKSFVADIIALEMYCRCIPGRDILVTSNSEENLNEIKERFSEILGNRFEKIGNYYTVKSKSAPDCKFFFIVASQENIIKLKGLGPALWYGDDIEMSNHYFLEAASNRLSLPYSKAILIGRCSNLSFGDYSITHNMKTNAKIITCKGC